jgi:hypothetical protein
MELHRGSRKASPEQIHRVFITEMCAETSPLLALSHDIQEVRNLKFWRSCIGNCYFLAHIALLPDLTLNSWKRSTCAQKFQKPGRVNPKCGPRTLDKQEPVICQTHTEAHCVSHPVLVALEKVSPVEEWHDIQSALRFILLFCDHSFEEVGRHG